MRLDELCDWLRADFGVVAGEVTPIGHGADAAASVWMVRAGSAFYAVKWTGGGSVAGLLLPSRLAELGVGGVPAPVRTLDGALWSERGGRRLSVQPWVGDARAVDAGLTPDQWTAFGALLARVHAVPPDDAVARQLPVEEHRPDAVLTATADVTARLAGGDLTRGRAAGGDDLTRGPAEGGDDLVRELAAAWRDGAELLGALTARAAVLGARLRDRDRAARAVVCHTDCHLGNVLLRSSRAVVGGPLPARVGPTLRAGTDTLAADTPAADAPSPDAPAADAPGPDTPDTDAPSPDTPDTDTPDTDTPSPDTPAANTPSPDTPAANTPSPDTPAADTPGPDTLGADAGADVWLIDWDDATLAPPERDLMFVVGGLPGYAPVGERELGWFAAGYGPVDVDADRLAYYRAVRALGDLTEFAAELLDPSGDRAGREFALSVVRAELAGAGLAGLAAVRA
ncbi:phosphotransferase [Jiangella sp. DSM 45060]|uniref:phosphotransferase n=1 Tax=Jiangella sp. DSM 45060 TaxID=1798224 RepID=UPI00087C7037|nr:phosphotransferase [Jiangella sp. DSM 45060]SDT51135.1 Phosphotransferase enzyme family protein [Jiangella sp. DSM 45060]